MPDVPLKLLCCCRDNAFVTAIKPIAEQRGFIVEGISSNDLANVAANAAIVLLEYSLFSKYRAKLQQLKIDNPQLLWVLLAEELSAEQWQEAMSLQVQQVFIKGQMDFADLDRHFQRLYEQGQAQRQAFLKQDKLLQDKLKLESQLDLLRKDLQVGRYVQEKLQPQSPLSIAKLTFEQRVIPSLFLSGDFVDYMPVNENYAFFCLADVAGHGASSTFITVLIKHLLVQLRRKANQDGQYELFEPDAVLLYLNAEMEKLNSGKHVTLIVGLIDNAMAQLRYCVAGHLPPPVLSSAGKSQYLLGGGPPIGLFATPNYTVKQVDLPLTWSISCFSDGVFELLKASSLKNCEAELLQRLKNTPQTLNTLEQELGLTKLSQVIDDVTVLNIRNS